MVLTIQDDEFLRMKRILLDDDSDGALGLVKDFVARLEQQSHRSLKETPWGARGQEARILLKNRLQKHFQR
jgi:hypothetical protein